MSRQMPGQPGQLLAQMKARNSCSEKSLAICNVYHTQMYPIRVFHEKIESTVRIKVISFSKSLGITENNTKRIIKIHSLDQKL